MIEKKNHGAVGLEENLFFIKKNFFFKASLKAHFLESYSEYGFQCPS